MKSIYKQPSIYNGKSIYNGDGIYNDEDDYVILNGVRYKNTFYKDNAGIYHSRFSEAVELPAGYEKLNYVRNDVLTSGTSPRITTDATLSHQYGSVYTSMYQLESVSSYGSTWRTGYINENTNCTRVIMDSSNVRRILTYSDMRAGSGGQIIISDNGIFGVEITDEKKYRLLDSSEYLDMSGTTQGDPNPDDNLYFFSQCARINLYFMFVADHDKQVTFTAIPCKHGSDYGIYDLVGNKFYTHSALTGA